MRLHSGTILLRIKSNLIKPYKLRAITDNITSSASIKSVFSKFICFLNIIYKNNILSSSIIFFNFAIKWLKILKNDIMNDNNNNYIKEV